jgi:hypothetical protein
MWEERKMQRRFGFTALAILASALFILSTASQGHAQNLQRFAAEFLKFDGGELHAGPSDTPAIDHGVSIWTDHVKVPGNVNVLYVTLSATGDTSNTITEAQFTCLVDGNFCNPGSTFDATAPGWIVLEEGSAVNDDNSINYTWCTPIEPLHIPGSAKLVHDVQLKLATNGNGTAFIEGIHVFVDGNKVKDPTQACVQGHN